MNARERTVVKVIREYRKMVDFIEKNHFDYSDYEDEGVAKEIAKSKCFDKMKEDLVDLCEDNGVMADAIREYFGEEVEENNEEIE